MSGSETAQKTSAHDLAQGILPGFSVTWTDPKTKRVYRLEGMGQGRMRVHSAKRQPKQK